MKYRQVQRIADELNEIQTSSANCRRVEWNTDK